MAGTRSPPTLDTAEGLFFMTLEDETGISNLIVLPEIFDGSSGPTVAGGSV